MLVLSRRKGEKIIIGNEIEIEVLSVSKDGVRLGINAPKETSVHRFEVFEEIEKANVAAKEVVKKLDSESLGNLSQHFRKDEKDEEA